MGGEEELPTWVSEAFTEMMEAGIRIIKYHPVIQCGSIHLDLQDFFSIALYVIHCLFCK